MTISLDEITKKMSEKTSHYYYYINNLKVKKYLNTRINVKKFLKVKGEKIQTKKISLCEKSLQSQMLNISLSN